MTFEKTPPLFEFSNLMYNCVFTQFNTARSSQAIDEMSVFEPDENLTNSD